MKPAPADAAPSLAVNAALMWSMFTGRAAASLVTTVMVARALGPRGRGEVTYIVSLSGLLALIATAGMAAMMLRALQLRHSHARDLYSDALDIGAAWCVLLVGGLGVTAIVVPDRRPELVVTALAVVAQVGQLSLANAATLDNRVWAVTWTSLVGVGGYALGTVAQVALGTTSVLSNLSLWISTTTISAVLLAWSCQPRFSRRRPHAFGWFWPRTLRATVASAAVLAVWRADVLLVRIMRGFGELGQYSVAVGAAEILAVLGTGLTSALLPNLAHDASDAIDQVCRVTRLTLAALLCASVVLALVAPVAIPVVFGGGYRHSIAAFVLLLPGVACFVAHAPLFHWVTSHGGTPVLTRIALGAVGFNIVSDLAALRWFGFTAAAVVSTITYAGLLVGCLAVFCTTAGVPASRVLVPERRDVLDVARAARALVPARA